MPVLGYSQRCLWEVHANTQHPGKRNTTMLRTEDFKHDGRSAMDAVCIFKKNAPFPQQGPVELGWPPRLLLWGRPCTTAHPPSPAPGAGKGAALLPSAGAAGSQPPRKKKEMFYFFSKPPSLLLCPAEGPGAASPPVSHNAPGRNKVPRDRRRGEPIMASPSGCRPQPGGQGGGAETGAGAGPAVLRGAEEDAEGLYVAVERCPLCNTTRRRLTCAKCVQSGDFVFFDGRDSERYWRP